MKSKLTIWRMALSAAAAAVLSLSLVGCGDETKKPAVKKPAAEHPKSEAPEKTEHPKSEHPKSEHPGDEHPR